LILALAAGTFVLTPSYFAVWTRSLQSRAPEQLQPALSGPAPRTESGGLITLRSSDALLAGFELNVGQADKRVQFLSRGRNYSLLFAHSEVLLLLERGSSGVQQGSSLPADSGTHLLRMKFLNSSPSATASGLDALPGKSNYFIGNNPATWRTKVPQYRRVQYQALYPGIDLVFYRNREQEIEFDFVVSPGADPEAIQLLFKGADSLQTDASGSLLLHTSAGALRLQRPNVYQVENDTRRQLPASYRTSLDGRVSFEVARYDPERPLVIDPVLDYSTYLGGSGSESGNAIAVDPFGYVYVAGSTRSVDFPTTPGAFQSSRPRRSREDAFVAKIDPVNSTLIYSTYLGGISADGAAGIAVDAEGNVYVTGTARSRDFPVTPGAFQTSLAGDADMFVTKLNANGDGIAYSTYVGGPCRSPWVTTDSARDIRIDSFGNAYVAGNTYCANFPITPGAFQQESGGHDNAIVFKQILLLFSICMGAKMGRAIRIDARVRGLPARAAPRQINW
jgi:hypothetical protein